MILPHSCYVDFLGEECQNARLGEYPSKLTMFEIYIYTKKNPIYAFYVKRLANKSIHLLAMVTQASVSPYIEGLSTVVESPFFPECTLHLSFFKHIFIVLSK